MTQVERLYNKRVTSSGIAKRQSPMSIGMLQIPLVTFSQMNGMVLPLTGKLMNTFIELVALL
jgi:hypothetical protein